MVTPRRVVLVCGELTALISAFQWHQPLLMFDRPLCMFLRSIRPMTSAIMWFLTSKR